MVAMRKIIPFLILVSLLAFSCASNSLDEHDYFVYVTNSAKYRLLPPSCMDGVLDCYQKMHATFGEGKSEKEFIFDAYVVSDQQTLSMCLFNDFGTTIAELLFDGKNIVFDTAVLPKSVRPEYIVADFQFCLYDAKKITDALENCGLNFYVEKNDSEEVRKIILGEKIIEKITRTENYIKCENFLRKYSYTLIRAEDSVQ